MEIENHVGEIKLIEIDKIIPNPKNPNKHTDEQIDRLAKIIKTNGFRRPITVSNRSGFVVVGHGRLMAAMTLNMINVPVLYQDYENEALEYADMVADNAIGDWSSLDLGEITTEMLEFPDFDIELMGLKDFKIDVAETDYSEKNKEIDTDNFGNDLEHTCPRCLFEFNG